MPYATPYDAQYNFYTGFPWDETQEGIWLNYPGLKFAEGGGEDAYTIDPTTIQQLGLTGYQDPFGGGALFQSSLTGNLLSPEETQVIMQNAAYAAGIPYSSIDPAKFQQDLAMYLQRSPYGIPVEGGRYGDNAGDGYTLGSLLSNEFVLAALAVGAAAGGAAALGGVAPAATSAGGAGAGIGGVTGGAGAGVGAATGGGVATGGATAAGGAAGFGGSGALGTSAALGTGGFGAGSIAAGTAAGAGGLGAGTTGGLTGGSSGTSGLGIVNGASGATLSPAGGTGLFGTGVTAGQALRGGMALGTGVAGLVGGSGSSGGSGGAGGAGGTIQDQQAENKEWARRLVTKSIAPRLAQFQEGINALTQQANASPMALTQRLSPQIEQARAALKQMFQQSAQRFGPFGGGQTEREQVRGAEDIGGKVGGLFGGATNQAREAIGKLIENFQTTPQPPAQIQTTNIGNTTQPFNPASVLASLQTGAALGRVGNRVGSWLDSPSGQGGNYGGISQGYDQYSIPYDYGFA